MCVGVCLMVSSLKQKKGREEGLKKRETKGREEIGKDSRRFLGHIFDNILPRAVSNRLLLFPLCT